MSNSIIFKHQDGLITTSNEKRLFKKIGEEIDGQLKYKWVEQPGVMLHKSEINLEPKKEDGNNGDYYASYIQKQNEIIYSEDFTQDIWYSNNITLKKASDILFPFNAPTIVYPDKSNSKHNLSYYFANNEEIYTFSIYFMGNSKLNIGLMLSNNEETNGYKINFNSDAGNAIGDLNLEEKITKSFIGEELPIYGHTIEKISENTYRISITGQILTYPTIKATIQILDNELNEEFEPENSTFGLWINAAQLDKNATQPSRYIYNNGEITLINSFYKLYHKSNDDWNPLESNRVLYSKDIPSSKIGNEGDICCIESLLTLEPYVRFGSSSTTTKEANNAGIIFYDKSKNKWFVRTGSKKNDVYELVYKNASTTKHDMAMALTLNQHTYHTYNGYGKYSFRKGFNTGGNMNFWGKKGSRF